MWKKILFGILAFIVLVIVLVLIFTKSITELANKQLSALRAGDIVTAYSYTSKDFQANTSLEDFKHFLEQYPGLKNNQKTKWTSREISNNTGTLIGSLIAADGGVTPIEYHFVKENNGWKVFSIIVKATGVKIIPANAAAATDVTAAKQSEFNIVPDISKGKIHRIIISDVYNSKSGMIVRPKTVIPASAPKVFVAVYILHAKAGLKVGAEMVRLANGAKIGPNVAAVTQSGNVVRKFSFTNTDSKWPVGDYRINILTSNGQFARINFKIQ